MAVLALTVSLCLSPVRATAWQGCVGFTLERFWQWDYFGEYLAFLLTFLAVGAAVTLLNLSVLHSSLLTEAIGSLALLIEATLAMPQCYQNWRNKSCQGLRYALSRSLTICSSAGWLAGG